MNPIMDARLSAGLSKHEFCRQLKLSRTFVLRAEEGCYGSPGDKLIEFSMRQLKISRQEFRRRYSKFQTETRLRLTENIEPLQVVNLVPVKRLAVAHAQAAYELNIEITSADIKIVKLHEEFRKWREGYWTSYVGFCQSLCVHPASVENYENGAYDAMPLLIRDALNEVSLIDDSFDPSLKWVYTYA